MRVCVDKAGMALPLLLAAQTKDGNLLLLTLPTQLLFGVVATRCSKEQQTVNVSLLAALGPA